MRAYDLIWKKKNGESLSGEEIKFFIDNYLAGLIPDYQAAALLMAICFQGLNDKETASLTMAIVQSGEQIDLRAISGTKVDKHSTGGVGDKTTLVLAPMVAAAGVPVAKMSGRALGHTGGTLDKLESIPGFSVSMKPADFIESVNRVGLAIMGQTGNLVPADKKLYALRDVTATVDCVPLIASSVMSKKIAAGADAIVLDVKMGSGAFVSTEAEALTLAKTMVEIGTSLGRRTVALITRMDQPLGYAVGNALEVREALDTLKGRGPADLLDICLELGSHMLKIAGAAGTISDGRERLMLQIAEGRALLKFREMVANQRGDPLVVESPQLLPAAPFEMEVKSVHQGFVQSIETRSVGLAAIELGAGRETKDDRIDPGAGLLLKKKVGDEVKVGDVLARLYSSQPHRLEGAASRVSGAYLVGPRPPALKPLIWAVVTPEGVDRSGHQSSF